MVLLRKNLFGKRVYEFPLMRNQYTFGDFILQVKGDASLPYQMKGKRTDVGCIKLTGIDREQGGKIGFSN
jgi:hypothetical protein